jgi:predicted nuclease of predicted toxin-antitoxin system
VSHRVKLLVDECLHTSLTKVATDKLYEAYHLTHLGMSGLRDHELMLRVRDEDLTFVTNNAVDFRRLFAKEPIHSGLVIIVPNVIPAIQRALFDAVLDHIGERDLTNRVLEAKLSNNLAVIEEYESPISEPRKV